MTELTTAPKRTLLDIVQHLAKLEAVAETIPIPESMLEAFSMEVEATLTAQGEKVDAYYDLITEYMVEAAEANAALGVINEREVDRLQKREKRARAQADRLKNLAVYVIRRMGKNAKGEYKKLEGLMHALKVANVPASCEVYDESLVPLEFKDATIKVEMTAEEWAEETKPVMAALIDGRVVNIHDYAPHGALQAALPVGAKLKPNENVLLSLAKTKVTYSVDRARLLKALKEECGMCHGLMAVNCDNPAEMSTEALQAGATSEAKICPKCNGAGTRLIPGARLLTGRLRLEIA